jgi:uncharacterized protein (DUF58 family)
MLPGSFTPDLLRQLELFRLRSRRAFLGTRQGGHISPKRGHGIEFSDYRQYELGDNPRHIDWGVYARSDRLYIKRYQEEQNLSLLVLMDTSPSMAVPAESGKWERARDVAVALSYVALMEQDSVVVSAPGFVTSPSYYGAQSIHALGRELGSLTSDKILDREHGVDFYKEVLLALSRVRFPGLCVVLSDLLMPFREVERLFNAVRARNLDITAIQVLGGDDLTPLAGVPEAIAVDSESGKEVQLVMEEYVRQDYQRLLLEHNRKIREFFARQRIGFISTSPAVESLQKFILTALPGTGLLQ